MFNLKILDLKTTSEGRWHRAETRVEKFGPDAVLTVIRQPIKFSKPKPFPMVNLTQPANNEIPVRSGVEVANREITDEVTNRKVVGGRP